MLKKREIKANEKLLKQQEEAAAAAAARKPSLREQLNKKLEDFDSYFTSLKERKEKEE